MLFGIPDRKDPLGTRAYAKDGIVQRAGGKIFLDSRAQRGSTFSVYLPACEKPAETRMGKGKGNPEQWVAVVKPGRVIYELQGVPEAVARGLLGYQVAFFSDSPFFSRPLLQTVQPSR